MRAFVNRRFLSQTRFDSAAPAGAAVVAHQVEREGEFELHVGHEGGVLARARLAVGTHDPRPAAPRAAVSVDLYALVRPGAAPPASLPTLAAAGWLSLTSSRPLTDHHVVLHGAKDEPAFDTRRLDRRSLFGLTLIRPGRYALRDAVTGAEAEVTVGYPVRGKSAYRPPEPLSVEVTDAGFGTDRLELSPAQGLVFRFTGESRVLLELVEPDDGPVR